jgi:hypothetical protein
VIDPALDQALTQLLRARRQHHGHVEQIRHLPPWGLVEQQVVAFGDQVTVAGRDDAAAGTGQVKGPVENGNRDVAFRFRAQPLDELWAVPWRRS